MSVRTPLRVLLFAALVLACAEGLLRVASLFASDRSAAWRPGAAVRILSIGDSHTFGTNVGDEESYPAQLQTLLNEIRPGRFSVINLGVPGMNCTQVRRRLPANEAMERVASELSLPIIDSSAAIARIPANQQEWKWMMHPSGPMYREIALDLVPLILE